MSTYFKMYIILFKEIVSFNHRTVWFDCSLLDFVWYDLFG